MNHDVLDDFIALLWTLEHMPNTLRDTLKSLLESLWLILLLDPNSCNICDFANEDEVDPAREFIVSKHKSRLASSQKGGG